MLNLHISVFAFGHSPERGGFLPLRACADHRNFMIRIIAYRAYWDKNVFREVHVSQPYGDFKIFFKRISGNCDFASVKYCGVDYLLLAREKRSESAYNNPPARLIK